jgi:hypothetical protein
MDQEAAFDLFVAVAPNRGLSWKGPTTPGFAGLEVSLQECRSILADLRDAGGNGLVVASRYRDAKVTAEKAKESAEKQLAVLRGGAADVYGPIEDAEDEGAWWTFQVSNLTEQEKGRIPGVSFISIDKLDGHVVSNDEREKCLRLSIP